nr:nucleotidyltransferase substrate binding protein [Synechococcus sp. CCY 9618]
MATTVRERPPGSRDTTRETSSQGLIVDGEGWMEMIRHRNLSTHTDDQAAVARIQATLSGDDLDGVSLARLDAALDDLLLPWRFDLSLRASLQSPELVERIERRGGVLSKDRHVSLV